MLMHVQCGDILPLKAIYLFRMTRDQRVSCQIWYRMSVDLFMSKLRWRMIQILQYQFMNALQYCMNDIFTIYWKEYSLIPLRISKGCKTQDVHFLTKFNSLFMLRQLVNPLNSFQFSNAIVRFKTILTTFDEYNEQKLMKTHLCWL